MGQVEPRLDGEHVEGRDPFRDADDQFDARVEGFGDRGVVAEFADLVFVVLVLGPHLQDVPADPQDHTDDHEQSFRTLEGVNGADILQVDRPTLDACR